ncbi:hypothetical protein [Mycoplasma parvum]|uniref:Uncharacterized protein n=1 Tax=Mycoplasma parvum str. Indiana TaxID=1403316 RepID=U5NBL8_9MOLU|nr:hypothetical protein [Mycoplasma parvum]AGX88946.1 hypothetical protein PRV_00905 [Mycoplasma parvum str. Indiana]
MCFGVHLEKYLSLGGRKWIKEKDVVTTERSKEGNEQKVSIDKELDVTVTHSKENNRYKNRIKVGVNCMDGDLIGWGDSFLDSKPSTALGWDKFQETFEKGLKGYLELIFGCNWEKILELKNLEKWWNSEGLGKGPENAAMVGIVARNGITSNEKLQRVNRNIRSSSTREGLNNTQETNFEKIWKLFEGEKPRDSRSKSSITNTAIEVSMYRREDSESSYIPMIQELVRESIARNLIRIVLGAQWCTKKDWNRQIGKQDCTSSEKYKVLGELKETESQNDQNEIFKNLKFDGTTGFKWNPGDGQNGGKPAWMWENVKKWNSGNDKKEWWKKVKEYLKEISTSSWFYGQNKEIAKILCYEIFKELIGKEKLKFFKEKEKWCKVGLNGASCPNGGLIWHQF